MAGAYQRGEVCLHALWEYKSTTQGECLFPWTGLPRILSHDLKTTAHCWGTVAKGLRNLWALRQTFAKLDTVMFTILNTTLVKTKLENCVQESIPRLKSDSGVLEKIERGTVLSELRLIHG